MAPNSYTNYYASPSQQQQQGTYNHSAYSNTRATAISSSQYSPTPAASVAQDASYPQYARTNDRYYSLQNAPNYSNRTHYDTNALGASSHNTTTNVDTGRNSITGPTYSNHPAQSHVSSQAQSYTPVPTTTHSVPPYTAYEQQQVRADSFDSLDSAQSTLSTHRAIHHSQRPAVQFNHRVESISERTRSPAQSQWTAYNQAADLPLSLARDSDNTSRAISQPAHEEAIQARPSRSNGINPDLTDRHTAVTSVVLSTVDPTQVYDPYQEYRRKAKHAEVKADMRKAAEAAEAAEAIQRADTEQAAKVWEDGTTKHNPNPSTAVDLTTTATIGSNFRKKRNRKSNDLPATTKTKAKSKDKRGTPTVEVDESAHTAAMTLMHTANSSGTGTDLEVQMRGMFRKMREFNEKDPDLLFRLWQQERDEHLAKAAAKESPSTTAPALSHKSSPNPKGLPTQIEAVNPVISASSKKSATPNSRLSDIGATSDPASIKKPAVRISVSSNTDVTSISALNEQVAVPISRSSNAVTTVVQQSKTSPASAVPVQLHHSTTTSTTTLQRSRPAGTVWPADKKQALAATASQLLQTIPANRGKFISASEISAILDTNPNYIELCQQVEKRGFKVDRGVFAKALLAAVPDVNKSAQKPMSIVSGGVATIEPNGTNFIVESTKQFPDVTNSGSVNPNTSLSNAADRLLNGGDVVETPRPTPVKTKIMKKPKDRIPTNQPSRVRKKKMSDDSALTSIEPTDLSQTLDVVSESTLEGMEAVIQFVNGSWHDVSTFVPVNPSSATKSAKTYRPPKVHARVIPSIVPPPSATKEDLARKRTFADLVDLTKLDSDEEPNLDFPPSKRHESDYLNNKELTHLPTPPETLIGGSVVTVAASSNTLATARGGEPLKRPIIPGRLEIQNPAVPVLPTGHLARSVAMVQPLDKYKAIRRSRYDSKTIARDILLACGRHPDMRHLNAHLEALKAVFSSVDNGSDLGTFRWDIADPGGPVPGTGNAVLHGLEEVDASDDTDDEDDNHDSDSVLGRATVRQAIHANGESGVELSHVGAHTANKIHPRKYRHSEHNFRNHADQSHGHLKYSEGGNTSTAPTHTALTDSVIPNGYSALRALQSTETGGTPKKRGRPVGWRKWMMKEPSGAQGLKTNVPKQVEPEPTPVYHVYKCEWRDCGAELHNLTTLRRHVYKLHGKEAFEGKYLCCWSDCGKVRSITETGRTSSRFVHDEFADLESWKKHVDKRHIQPIAWEFGDGPAAGLSDQQDSELSDAYLSDSRGRRVTPTVIAPSLSASVVSSTPRGLTNAEREARELLHIAEKRKRNLGPGIDRGGARLANGKRRQGFIDDDGTAEVVDEDD